MTSERVAAVAWAFIGALLGATLVWVLAPLLFADHPASLEQAVTRLSSAAEQLRTEVQQLNDAVDRVRLSSATIPSSPSPSEPLVPVVPKELLDRLDDLKAALERLATNVGQDMFSGTQQRVAVVPLIGVEHPAEADRLESMVGAVEVNRDLQHFGWSYQKVLDAYGQPSRIGPSSNGVGQKWFYELPGGHEIMFWFVDGAVAKILDLYCSTG